MLDPWVIGALINLSGSVLINVGTNLIKYHHIRAHQHTVKRATLPNGKTHTLTGQRSSVHDVSVADNSITNHSDAPLVYGTDVSPSHTTTPHPPAHRHTVSCFRAVLTCGRRKSGDDSVCCMQQWYQLKRLLFNSNTNTQHRNTKSHWWYIGFCVFFVGNVTNFISFGFAAQSLLAGLGSIQFISNVFCSVIVLKQHLTNRILLATLAIVIGNFLIVVYASHSSPQLNVDDLWSLYFQTPYKVYMTILLFMVITLYVFYKEAKVRLYHYTRTVTQETQRSKLWLERLIPCAYAAISAIIGTQSVLLAKSSSELVRITISGQNQFVYPFTYLILVAWLSSMVFWLYRMNSALRKFDGVFIIPVLQVVWTLFSIVGGGIYFQEFDSFSVPQIGCFAMGVSIVIFGVYLLAPQQHHTSHYETSNTGIKQFNKLLMRARNSDADRQDSSELHETIQRAVSSNQLTISSMTLSSPNINSRAQPVSPKHTLRLKLAAGGSSKLNYSSRRSSNASPRHLTPVKAHRLSSDVITGSPKHRLTTLARNTTAPSGGNMHSHTSPPLTPVPEPSLGDGEMMFDHGGMLDDGNKTDMSAGLVSDYMPYNNSQVTVEQSSDHSEVTVQFSPPLDPQYFDSAVHHPSTFVLGNNAWRTLSPSKHNIQHRARGMSLGFSLPVIDLDDDKSDNDDSGNTSDSNTEVVIDIV